jgi:hypothetical protein
MRDECFVALVMRDEALRDECFVAHVIAHVMLRRARVMLTRSAAAGLTASQIDGTPYYVPHTLLCAAHSIMCRRGFNFY